MKGYKYLLDNMEAPFVDDFFYELNKWYEVEDDSKLEICEYGFHFFKDIRDLLSYVYNEVNAIHIYEVDVDGNILHDGANDKYCSSKIKIVKELEKEEILKIIEERDMVHDTDYAIRITVAKYGYGLDTLINDKDIDVREEVARQGYGLDTLINDPEWPVRMAVAEQGYGLDILINDEEPYVREAVAKQGYGLDKLINDKDILVREIARSKMNE